MAGDHMARETSQPDTQETLVGVIAKLPRRQRDVLLQVAFNNDAGHHQRTLQALAVRGLILSEMETLGGRFPVQIRRYYTPIQVHMAVCAWCSKQEVKKAQGRS